MNPGHDQNEVFTGRYQGNECSQSKGRPGYGTVASEGTSGRAGREWNAVVERLLPVPQLTPRQGRGQGLDHDREELPVDPWRRVAQVLKVQGERVDVDGDLVRELKERAEEETLRGVAAVEPVHGPLSHCALRLGWRSRKDRGLVRTRGRAQRPLTEQGH